MRLGLIRLSSLGDVVLTTGVVRELKSEAEDAEITVITCSPYDDIFKLNPRVRETVLLEDKSINGLSALIRRVREQRFDILVDLHVNPRSLLISSLSKSRKKLRYGKCRWARNMMLFTKERKVIDHVVVRYFRPFEKIGFRYRSLKPEIWIDDDARMSANLLMGHIEKPVVAISPGARRMTKRWPAEEYARLCRLLIERKGVEVVLVGDPDDVEVARRVKTMANGVPFDLTGKTSLLELAAVLQTASVLVTNDSGCMHVAGAMKTPVVAIFGPTVPEFGFFPLGERDRVIQKEVSCRPCSLHGSDRCRHDGFTCMRLIRAEEVLEEVCNVLDGP